MSNANGIMIGLGFTIFGFALQILNVSYGIRHAINRPTVFNLILLLCLFVAALSFIPLFYTSLLSFDFTRSSLQFIPSFNQAHNSFFAISTLMYLMLVQIRFRIIKTIVPYSSIYDIAFVIFTIAVWAGTIFYFGIIAFTRVSAAQSLTYAAIWTMYVMIVDNVLSGLFLYHLFKCRSKVSNTDHLKQLWTQAVAGLGLLCGITWLCLALILVAILCFPNDASSRGLMYRIAYAFSPLEYSGALVFIYTIRALFEGQTDDKKSKLSVNTSSQNATIVTISPSSPKVYSPPRSRFE